MIIPEIDQEITSQTTTIVKLIQLPYGTCLHTNNVKITNVDQPQEQATFPQINTRLEQISSNCFKNNTHILHMNREYNVEDIYQFQLDENLESYSGRQQLSFMSDSIGNIFSEQFAEDQQQQSSQKSHQSKKTNNKKICFFPKIEKLNDRYIKRNTKNIPKNFCKAFANYMEQKPNKQAEQWVLAMRKFKKIEKSSKYNNITMKKILQNQAIAPFFKDFLTNYAQEWISSSKITDKQVHILAINIYLELIDTLTYAEVPQSVSEE